MSVDDQKVEIFFDRKKQSTLLNLIENDCGVLYDHFHHNKDRLKQIIELYEEFMTIEMNQIFELCNGFTEILLQHRQNFRGFLQNITSTVDQRYTNGVANGRIDDMFVIFITIQEWLLQGPKGQQFYLMVDIDAFRFYPHAQANAFHNGTNGSNGIPNGTALHMAREKLGRLSKYGDPFDSFVAFKNHSPFTCDAQIADKIRQVCDKLKSNFCAVAGDGVPAKCSYLLLPKLFYGLYVYCEPTNNNQVQISVNNRKYTFNGDGPTPTKAKNNVSQRVLKSLCQIDGSGRADDIASDIYEMNFADEIEKLVTKCCDTIPVFADAKKNTRNVIAGIIQTENLDLTTAKVVALASGTKSIDAESMHIDGTVYDTHAEVVARRSLLVYFYDQLDMFSDPKRAAQSIFTWTNDNTDVRCELKDGIQFHLFITRGPCGDATSIFYVRNPNDYGKLRAKVEKKEGYPKVEDIRNDEQLPGAFHEGVALYTATCSDKIARWNVVGIQGALLSRLVQPIYLNSIIINIYNRYTESDFLRAFHDRINGAIPELQPPYRHHKPKIAFASTSYKRDTHSAEASPISLNWIVNRTPTYERIQSKTGIALKDTTSFPSRISKKELMKRFVNAMQRLPQPNGNTAFDANQTYGEMKMDATNYQRAKDACVQAFDAKNLGKWNKVQKPSEIEGFKLS